MIRLGTLQPDGSAVLNPDEVTWLRHLFARIECAYQTTVVSDKPGMSDELRERMTDRGREHCSLRLGELIAEDGPAGDPYVRSRFIPTNGREVLMRAMVVRGGFPPGEPLISRSVHRVMPDAAIMAGVPGAWITDGQPARARNQGPDTPPEADVIPIRPSLDFVSTDSEEE